MKIVLIGYMGSGKSTISKYLSAKMAIQNLDLDTIIEKQENSSIVDIFKKKGEIYFRKLEYEVLNSILKSDTDYILSVGGGTPVYFDSMELINKYSESIYLRLTPIELKQRLINEKYNRPLISHLKDEELEEFIAKHLFERNQFYMKAKYIIQIKDKSVEDISLEIIKYLVLL